MQTSRATRPSGHGSPGPRRQQDSQPKSAPSAPIRRGFAPHVAHRELARLQGVVSHFAFAAKSEQLPPSARRPRVQMSAALRGTPVPTRARPRRSRPRAAPRGGGAVRTPRMRSSVRALRPQRQGPRMGLQRVAESPPGARMRRAHVDATYALFANSMGLATTSIESQKKANERTQYASPWYLRDEDRSVFGAEYPARYMERVLQNFDQNSARPIRSIALLWEGCKFSRE
jgi:hypothetical protein